MSAADNLIPIGTPIPWYADATGELEVTVYKDLHGFSPAFPAIVLLSTGMLGGEDAPACLNLARLDALIGKLATARKLIVAAGTEATAEEKAKADYPRVGEFERGPAPDGVAELIEALGLWRHTERDAAREAAEVIAEDDGVRLLKTSMGEWGIDNGEVLHWEGGNNAERIARGVFADERDKALCETCPAEVDADELTEAGEDGPMVCPACNAERLAESKAAPYAHDAGSPGEDGCTWSGIGADIKEWDEDALCPTCSAPVQEVITLDLSTAPAAEPTP